MSDENTVLDATAAKVLSDGQWVQDADGTFLCLMDTHMGFPQRMAMVKGGRSLWSLDCLSYPLHLCDLDLDEPCPHRWGLIGEGHCRRCGVMVEFRPLYFEEGGMEVFRAAAESNSRADRLRAEQDGGES